MSLLARGPAEDAWWGEGRFGGGPEISESHLPHMTDLTTIVVVDDNRVVREGIASLLDGQPDVQVVATCPDGAAALEVIERTRPKIVLADATAPGKRGVVLAREVCKRGLAVKVITTGLSDEPGEVTEAVEAGASGYVVKEATADDLLGVVRAVARGEAPVSPRIAATLFSRLAELAATQRAREISGKVKLTPREIQVLGLVADRLTNKQIAARLYVETQTVKNHVHNILEKLNLRHRYQAVQYAQEIGLLRRRPLG